MDLPETLVAEAERILREVFENGIMQTREFEYAACDKTLQFEARILPEFTDKGTPESILVILRDVTERKRAEAEMENYHEQLQRLSKRLLEAHEAERRKIAMELHDEIGQVLTAVQLTLHGIKDFEKPEDVPERLGECIALVETSLQQVRDLSVDLRPWMLDQLGLVPSVRWYVDRQAQRGKFKAEIDTGTDIGRFSQIIETTCYRIIQESLTNILRYARATEVRVSLQKRENELQVNICDNGIGFDIDEVRSRKPGEKGLGLMGMEERVSLLGGKFHLQSQPGKGTTIKFCLSLND
jgi:signal transduction histidine kinase